MWYFGRAAIIIIVVSKLWEFNGPSRMPSQIIVVLHTYVDSRLQVATSGRGTNEAGLLGRSKYLLENVALLTEVDET